MHPLLPDDYRFHDHRSGELLGQRGFLDIQGDKADDELRRIGLPTLLYSFGIAHPGAIRLHNYPRSLQTFERDGELIDLSVVDLVRPAGAACPATTTSARACTSPGSGLGGAVRGPRVGPALREVYRSIDEVDTMVGLFAETPPEGFGFSDTAFRIFILMASRRLQSDRFLTVDFRPEIYSPFGIDWIANNGMTSVILRHCPDLQPLSPGERGRVRPRGDLSRRGPAQP